MLAPKTINDFLLQDLFEVQWNYNEEELELVKNNLIPETG